MTKILLLTFMLLPVIAGIAQNKQSINQKGKLFIIGGGHISDSLRMQILTTAHWNKGDLIAAVTLASGYGDSAYIWYE